MPAPVVGGCGVVGPPGPNMAAKGLAEGGGWPACEGSVAGCVVAGGGDEVVGGAVRAEGLKSAANGFPAWAAGLAPNSAIGLNGVAGGCPAVGVALAC